MKDNYFNKTPIHSDSIFWNIDNKGYVTIIIANKGLFNRIAQKLLKKPKKTYIHLDELGSFIWLNIDGNRNITDLGKEVYIKFQDNANPLYERLLIYFKILEQNHFIVWKNERK